MEPREEYFMVGVDYTEAKAERHQG